MNQKFLILSRLLLNSFRFSATKMWSDFVNFRIQKYHHSRVISLVSSISSSFTGGWLNAEYLRNDTCASTISSDFVDFVWRKIIIVGWFRQFRLVCKEGKEYLHNRCRGLEWQMLVSYTSEEGGWPYTMVLPIFLNARFYMITEVKKSPCSLKPCIQQNLSTKK